MCEGMRMDAEEQIILLRQEIVALRKALADSQKYANDVKKELDKEVGPFVCRFLQSRLKQLRAMMIHTF